MMNYTHKANDGDGGIGNNENQLLHNDVLQCGRRKLPDHIL
jgi:hypothetical protein